MIRVAGVGPRGRATQWQPWPAAASEAQSESHGHLQFHHDDALRLPQCQWQCRHRDSTVTDLEGWDSESKSDVLYNLNHWHLECYITKPVCYITILEMLYNMCSSYTTCASVIQHVKLELKVI